MKKYLDKKQNSCYNIITETKESQTQQKKRGKIMKVFIKNERKIIFVTFTRWEEGTSGFSDDGYWSGDWADEVLGDVKLLVIDAGLYLGTHEDVDAMVDFLHEYAMDSEDEWSVDVGDEIVSDTYYEILCEA